jgi:hypothetical protein
MEDLVKRKKQLDNVIETFVLNKQNMIDWFQTYTNMKQNKEMLDSFSFQTPISTIHCIVMDYYEARKNFSQITIKNYFQLNKKIIERRLKSQSD